MLVAVLIAGISAGCRRASGPTSTIEPISLGLVPVDIGPESIDGVPDHSVEQFVPTAGEHLDVVGAPPWHEAGLDLMADVFGYFN